MRRRTARTGGSVSRRSQQIQAATPFRMLFGFLRRRAAEEAAPREPGVLDFTFGDPHELAMPAYVEALRAAAVPRDELWFAYKQSERRGAGRGRGLARAGRPARLDRRPPPHDDRWLRRDHRGDEGGGRPR